MAASYVGQWTDGSGAEFEIESNTVLVHPDGSIQALVMTTRRQCAYKKGAKTMVAKLNADGSKLTWNDGASWTRKVKNGIDLPKRPLIKNTPWEPMPEAYWRRFPRAGDGEKPTNMPAFKKVVHENLPGEFWGLKFPHSPEQLKAYGPTWLTTAMQTCGVLPLDNKITAFTKFVVKADDLNAVVSQEDNNWGGACIKILLSVEYEKDPGNLSKNMFVKVPHEFTGKNERFRLSVSGSDWPEAMFYNTLAGRLPVKTPLCYFCDMNRKTTNFIFITECLPFGAFGDWEKKYKTGEFLPAPGKYRDWSIPCAADLYYAHAKAMAAFFGFYRKTRSTSPQLDLMYIDEGGLQLRQGIYNHVCNLNKEDRDKWFLWCCSDPSMAGIVQSQFFQPSICQGFLEMAEDLIKNMAPNVFPKELVEDAFLEKFFKEAQVMSFYGAEMVYYGFMMPEYFSLQHPNAQLDNAFYFMKDDKEIESGLLDFGGLGHGIIPHCLANAWIGGEPDMMDEHEEKLTKFFLDKYEETSGERLDLDDFYLHVKLSQAVTLYGCFANVRWLRTSVKPEEWATIESRKDPRIDDSFLVRCYFVQVEMLLSMWKKRCPYPFWQKWMERTKMTKKHP